LHHVQFPVNWHVAHGAFVMMHIMPQAWLMRLKELRELRGLTQRDLAEMIGMDAATVNRAEKMAHTAKLATYRKCASALGVSLADIFTEDFSPLERDLVQLFRGASQETREHLVGLLRVQQGGTGSLPEDTPPAQPETGPQQRP
jgi:transcriptional regulator with XRE-family HTH domain